MKERQSMTETMTKQEFTRRLQQRQRRRIIKRERAKEQDYTAFKCHTVEQSKRWAER